jgi:diguanylate cyclase (GGDEF)-like protein/PAS domain S-box-containing protein
MPLPALDILLIEADAAVAERVETAMRGSGAPRVRLIRQPRLAAGLDALAAGEVFDLVLVDLELPDGQGFEVFLRTLAAQPSAAVAVLARERQAMLVERVLRAGARDAVLIERLDQGALSRLLREVGSQKAARQEAERSEASYRAIFDAVNDAILVLGLDGDRILDANRPGQLMFGHPIDQLRRMQVGELIGGDEHHPPAGLLAYLQKAALGEPQIFEWRARRADGTLFWVEINLKLATINGREQLLAVVRDITARRNTEAANARLAALPRYSPYPILECDANGSPIYINPATQAVLRLAQAELGALLPANHGAIVRACLASGEPTADVDGELAGRLYSWFYRPVPELGVVHLHALDVTARRRAEDRLQQNALLDVLTGLPNRALLRDRLERNLDLQQRHDDYRFAVLLLDLDRFKRVNESLGHDGGDLLLQEVTARLQRCIKQADTVARTGGDEFVLLLEDIGSPGNVTRIADRIQRELARPFSVSGRTVYLSASTGIVISEPDATDPKALLQEAETAMYRAKSEGPGRYTVFDEAQHASGAELFQLENDFQLALERGELVTYYQPLLATHSGRIIGFEALVRWQHPSRGLLSPGAFIAMAEETGLIEPMAEQVIEAACAQTRRWHAAGYSGLTASVNLSGMQFRRPDLAERVLTLLRRSGLDPRWLKVEVTEGVAAGDAAHTIATLNRLRELGIGVMIDDFGTGYSSLGYLKRLPVDAIKIDRTFVMDVTEDHDSAAIVTTIILMAHALGFEVVGEGVEREDQLAFLREHGCDVIQGYLYSRPVPAAQFDELLARYNPPIRPGA